MVRRFMKHSRAWARALRVATRWALALGSVALVAGCAASALPSHPGTPPASGPPSLSTIKRLLPKHQVIAKVATLRWKGQPPEDIVVTTSPPGKLNAVGAMEASVIAWSSAKQMWRLLWRSPALDVQQSYLPTHVPPTGIAAWQVRQTAAGAIVGLLDNASLGADVSWNDGVLVWVPSNGLQAPKLLWMAKGPRELLADGGLQRTAHGIRVTQYYCSAVEAVQRNGHAHVEHLSCTALLSRASGQRLRFTVHGGKIHPAQTTLTVAEGTTLVFWPGNAATAALVNDGDLGLYGGNFGQGGPAEQIPLDSADAVPHWAFRFQNAGTFTFAIVPSTSTGATAPVGITVTVTG